MNKLFLIFTSLLICVSFASAQTSLPTPQEITCTVPGDDFNCDGRVSAADLNLLVDLWTSNISISQDYVNSFSSCPAYKLYLENLISSKEGVSAKVTGDEIGRLGYQFSICSKSYLSSSTSDATLQASYLNFGEDYSGRWYQFGPSSKYGDGYSPDFSFNVTVNLTSEKKIIAFTLVHNVQGEAWSSSDDTHDLQKLLYPVVVYDVAQAKFITKGYSDLFAVYPSGKHNFILYTQSGASFQGGYLTVYFSDGSSAKTYISPKDEIIIDNNKNASNYLNDGISLGKIAEGEYGCFGCGKTLCVDPSLSVVMIPETPQLYCSSDFIVLGISNGNPNYLVNGSTNQNSQDKGKELSFAQNCYSGCLLDNICYPIGYKTDTKYCVPQGTFDSLKESNAVCNNSFECSSNICLNNKCADQGFIQKIIDFFNKLFG
ncbi:MAG: hypothetical protein AABW82_02695 [Nanoarchaeota archaeon]